MQDYQNCINGHSEHHRSQFVGEVLQIRAGGWAETEPRHHFTVSDRQEVVHSNGNRVLEPTAKQNQDREAIEVAQGSTVKVWVPLATLSEGALIARPI